MKNLSESLTSGFHKHKISSIQGEALYSLAYDLYQRRQYADAKAMFALLIIKTPFEAKNLMGMAACLQAEGHYFLSLNMYKLCMKAGLKCPSLHFYIANCLLHMGNKRAAVKHLKLVLDDPDGSDKVQELQTKAKGIIEIIDLS